MEMICVEITSESQTLYFFCKEAFERNYHSLLQANCFKAPKIVPLIVLDDNVKKNFLSMVLKSVTQVHKGLLI